jgi:hypothetical protein
MATSEDILLAIREDFYMATDKGRTAGPKAGGEGGRAGVAGAS